MLLVCVTALLGGCIDRQSADRRPNIVVILIDTLRADHIGAYGYDRPTTPVIDELARTGVRFENAVSQSSWTLPSIMSLFTSLHPRANMSSTLPEVLDDAEITLAERLREAGYSTMSVATNPYTLHELTNVMQGFDDRVAKTSAKAGWVVDQAINRLEDHGTRDSARPFFLYLHLMDVHTPYSPPPPFDSMFDTLDGAAHTEAHRKPAGVKTAAELSQSAFAAARSHTLALYDGGLRYADTEIGRLLDYLRTKGLRENTVIAIASDHGEAFWDNVELEETYNLKHTHASLKGFGVEHSNSLLEEQVSVPLILNGPGVEPGVDPLPARNLDLAPTLMARSGVPFNAGEIDGTDLRRRDAADTPAAVSETWLFQKQVTLVQGDRQLIRIGDEEILFDTIERPWRLIADEPETIAAMSAALDSYLEKARRIRSRRTTVDQKTVDSLRALGYLQ